MKRTFKYLFILVNLVFLGKPIFAQDCPTVLVEVFPRNPQIGQYNYFGVRVTLDFICNEDITVTGYIHKDVDEENNQDHPFLITVEAGHLTSETSDDFYQTGATDGASITLASITPCPYWWEGQAPNAANPNDMAGFLHNKGIIYSLNLTSGSWIDRTVSYANTLQSGINYDSIISIATAGAYAALHDSTSYVPTYMSTGGQNYASQLISFIDNIEETSDIHRTLDSVKNLEFSISSSGLTTNEKVALLSASSVARYSIYYWLENVDSSEVAINEYNFKFNCIDQDIWAFNTLPKHSFGPSVSIELMYIPCQNLSCATLYYRGGWFRRLLRTVVGDVVGALVGAGVGSFLPGGPATVFFGAVIGGISGSLTVNDSDFIPD